jgi:hypothetical protein
MTDHIQAERFNRSISHHRLQQRWRFRKDGDLGEEGIPPVLMGASTPEQEAYALWLALPKAHPQPRHAYQVAENLGVSKGTLSYWEQQPGFGAGHRAHTTNPQGFRRGRRSSAHGPKARDEGDVAAARLVLQAVGLLDLTQHLQQTLVVHNEQAERERATELRREQRRQMFANLTSGGLDLAGQEPKQNQK